MNVSNGKMKIVILIDKNELIKYWKYWKISTMFKRNRIMISKIHVDLSLICYNIYYRSTKKLREIFVYNEILINIIT